MRRSHLLASTTSLVALALVGCGGGGGSDRAGSQSTAPITSNTPGPINSATPGPISTPVTPGTKADILASSFMLDTLTMVDARAGTVTNSWAVGDGPTDVAHRINEAYVTNAMSQDLTIVDRLANGTMSTVALKDNPTGISFISNFDSILSPLVRPTGVAVTPNGAKAFTANLLNVSVVDLNTNTKKKSMLGLAPLNLSTILSAVTTGGLSGIGTALSNFMAAPVQGLGMAKVACTNDYALATCLITGKVMRIDARNDSVIDYVQVGKAPLGIAITGTKAYVTCLLSQEIYVIDVATGTVLTTIAASMVPVDVSTSKLGDRVYVANLISGDISVIDPAVDLVIDTLPAGLSIQSIFNQLGITLPTGTGGGIGGILNGVLQGFTAGMSNPNSFGALIAGGSGTSLLSPANLINGVLSGVLAAVGINSTSLAGMNLPGIGIFSIGVAEDPLYICTGNALMGDLVTTNASNRTVGSMRGLTGIGPSDVCPIWPL